MGFFSKVLQTTFDVVALPVDIVKDVATMGGAVIDEPSAVVERAKKIAKHMGEAYDSLDDD